MSIALVMTGGTIETLKEQQFEYSSRITRYLLTAAESPVAFWCTIAAQVAIVIASLGFAIAPLTRWGKARKKARREAWDARIKALDAQDRILKKTGQNRKDEKRKKKNRRKRK